MRTAVMEPDDLRGRSSAAQTRILSSISEPAPALSGEEPHAPISRPGQAARLFPCGLRPTGPGVLLPHLACSSNSPLGRGPVIIARWEEGRSLPRKNSTSAPKTLAAASPARRETAVQESAAPAGGRRLQDLNNIFPKFPARFSFFAKAISTSLRG